MRADIVGSVMVVAVVVFLGASFSASYRVKLANVSAELNHIKHMSNKISYTSNYPP